MNTVRSHKITIFITTAIIVLLFSAELTAYAKEYLNQTILEILLYLFVSSLMLLYAFRTIKKINKSNPFWIMLFIYLAFLFVRLITDFVIPDKGFFLYQSPSTIIFFFTFPILIPTIFFYNFRIYPNIKLISIVLLLILSLCILKSIYDILNGNAILNNDGRFDTAIFSISLGQYSTSLVLLGVYLFLNERKIYRYIYIPFCAIGIMGVLFSGSRGPFVSLLACLFFYAISKIKHWQRIVLLLIIVIVSWELIGELLMSLNDFLKSEGINSFDRVVTSIFSEDGVANHTSGRDGLYEEALQLFLNNPIFGNSYLIPGKIYVHNIIIEQYMATGIIGGTLFLGFNLYAFIKGFKLMINDSRFAIIPLLLLQYFIFGCLSVTILALFPYWVCLLLTMNQYDNFIINGRIKKQAFSIDNYPHIS